MTNDNQGHSDQQIEATNKGCLFTFITALVFGTICLIIYL